MTTSDWVRCTWFEERGPSLVHPDDLASFRQLVPAGRLFVRVDEQDGYAVLRYRDATYRVRPEVMVAVPRPAFGFGEEVRVKDNGKVGTVVDIRWHHARRCCFFHLAEKDKRYSRRLFAEDLANVALRGEAV